MKTIKKKNIIIIAVLLFLLVALACTVCLYYVRHIEESELYKIVSPYRDGEKEWQM